MEEGKFNRVGMEENTRACYSSGSTLCGVDVTSSQIMLDPSCDLSTQQTTDFWANFDDESYFSRLYAEFEELLMQVYKLFGHLL